MGWRGIFSAGLMQGGDKVMKLPGRALKIEARASQGTV